MENNLEKTTRDTGDIDIKEIFHIIWKYLVWEILIIAIVLSAGVFFAVRTKEYYIADASVIVKAKANTSDEQKDSDIVLSREAADEICELLTQRAFAEQATSFIDSNSSIGPVSIGSITTSHGEESIFIKIAYRDATTEKASVKLMAVLDALDTFFEETNEDGNSKNFSVTVSVLPIAGVDDEYGIHTSVASNRSKILIISAVASIVCVFVFVLIIMLFGDKVSTVSKLEKVTGKKNFITIEKKRRAKDSSKSSNAPSTEASKFLRFKVDKLSDMLIYLKEGNNNQVYQIQSAASGEGKTTVAVSLAINLAKNARKVLIIDCDFSHPSVHRAFGLSKTIGITDYFKGELELEKAIKKTAYENIDVLTRGAYVSDHTVFFTSKKFKSIISSARDNYDFVILDCAPVKALSDYINISPHVDGTLLVVESGRTNAKELSYVVDELESCKANVVGTVLNFSSNTFGKEYYYYRKMNKDNVEDIKPVGLMEDKKSE